MLLTEYNERNHEFATGRILQRAERRKRRRREEEEKIQCLNQHLMESTGWRENGYDSL